MDGRAAVTDAEFPEPPLVMAFPAPRAVERAESVVKVKMVENEEFVPDAGTMVVIVTGRTDTPVEMTLVTGRSL